ncbi:tetratricopeptide repeat protein [Streptomyces sp. PTM05]|uniref:Tetratricopeptide repeat protein n=1 Tax=Streptantibioticus parmotrematis TaxID=2873249 RepID=A0ABS7QMW8_9ACTN|nr:tetratricopeptide repeat protein [Streptantibioticus parmotrematis]MBY8884527.1 tetratricopeptide repeat protein [Streptantibioticus parmotrematis]
MHDSGHDEGMNGRGESAGGVHNDLGGTVEGTSVQVGVVHGGIHLAASTSRAQQPWQLPPVGALVDRVADLEALQLFLRQAEDVGGPAWVVITGLGGVGKTVLALSWLHRLRGDFPDGQLYVDLGSQSPGGPVAPAQALGSLLRGLGVPAASVPGNDEERMALYRSLTTHRKLVVMLDDAFSAAQVRPLLAGGRTVTVVTSRWQLPGLALDGCSALRLEPLEVGAAVALLAATVGEDRVGAEPEQARCLVGLCAQLPLAVRLVGARLASRPDRSITAMVRVLGEERGRLDALGLQGDHTVRATLDVSYGGLPPHAGRLYRLLALQPGTEFGLSAILSATGDIVRHDGRTMESLETLLDANLLSEGGDQRYRFHDLVRLHATVRSREEPAGSRSAAIRRIFDYYLASATRAEEVLDPHHRSLPRDFGPGPTACEEFADDSAALDWLERELPNMMAVVAQAHGLGLPRVSWQLADAMWPLFTRRKHYEQWRVAHREGLTAARESGDPAAECRMLTSGGLGELDTGGHGQALEMFSDAAELFRRTGDRLGVARATNYRGLALLGLGRLDEAATAFRQAAADCPRYGDARAGGLARLNLAEVALATDAHTEAVAQASTAYRILVDEGDPYNAARATTVLGHAALALGRLDQAARHFTQGLATLRRVGARFEVGRVLEALAQLAEACHELSLARTRYEEALACYEELRVPAAERVRAHLVRLAQAGDG